MNLVIVGNRVVNLAQVALIEREEAEGTLTVHFAVPVASVAAGVSYPYGGTPPVASDHLIQHFQGDEARSFWKQVTGE